MPKASQSPVDDDPGRVDQSVEGALPRSSAFYSGRRRVSSVLSERGSRISLVRNVSPEDDRLRGIVVEEGQISEVGIPIKESDMSARATGQRGEHSTYDITEGNVVDSMCKRWLGSGRA